MTYEKPSKKIFASPDSLFRFGGRVNFDHLSRVDTGQQTSLESDEPAFCTASGIIIFVVTGLTVPLRTLWPGKKSLILITSTKVILVEAL